MKKNFGIVLAVALGLSALLLTIAFQAGWVNASVAFQERFGAPTIVSYQGNIWDGDKPYDGTGYFKFAIMDSTGSTQYWSNDLLTEPPLEYITLAVVNGLFSVNLGDTSLPGMSQPLTASVFNNSDTRLRVWFSPEGDGQYTQLPDQKIAAVPYALQAKVADLASHAYNAETLDFMPSTSFQLRVTGTCPDGQAVQSINTDGTVVCEPITPPLTNFNIGTTYSPYISMVIGVDGYPLIAYYDTLGDLVAVHCENQYCSTFGDTTIDNLSNSVSSNSSITIGRDGLGLISYFDVANDDLKVAHCNDIACSTATNIAIDQSGSTGEYSSITIGADGLGLISYFNGTTEDLKVAHCNNTACTSATSYTLDTTGPVGMHTSITLGTDGLGLISYLDFQTEDLKTAHCNDIACTSASVATIDSTVGVGYHTSIAIGTDGMGLISYYDDDNSSLKVAHCSNITCSNAKIYFLDSNYGAGYYSDITIGADGLGLISYYDGFYQTVKVAHCINTACSMAYIYSINTPGWTSSTSIAIGVDGMGMIAYNDGMGIVHALHCGNRFCNPDY